MNLGYFLKWGDFMGFFYGGERRFTWRIVVEGDFGETGAELGVFGGVVLLS